MDSQKGGSKKKEKDEKETFEHLIPPWPEWNDALVNSEKWDAPRSTSGKSKDKAKQTDAEHSSGFSNPVGHGVLPNTFKVEKWVRPNEYKPDAEFLLYDGPVESNVDLLNLNNHLLNSPIIRAIISSISNLLRLAYKMPFEIETNDQMFIPTFDRIWQPWHHIYSLCKAGKGQIHNPVINPNGKYIVRLFYMGVWRKITVDDYLPLDEGGRLLLPWSKENELWLPILSKALIQIGSLSWSDNDEITDFNVITCFTGWVNYTINCQNIEPRYIWLLCQKLLMADQEDDDLRYGGVPVYKQDATDHYSSVGLNQKMYNIMSSVGLNQRMYNITDESNTFEEYEVLGPVVILGDLNDLSEIPDAIQGISPCLEHLIMISEARIIKDNQDPDRPPTPLWKKFRWKAWAIKKGIIKDQPIHDARSIRIFSSMKNYSVPDYTELLAPEPSLPTETISKEKQIEIQDEKNVDKGKKKSKKDLKSESSSKKTPSDKKSKKSDGKKGKVPKINIVQLNESPEELDQNEPWFDIKTIMPILRCLEIYIRPSWYEHNFKFNTLSELGPKTNEKVTTGKRSEKTSEKEKTPIVRTSKHDCFYLFVDSPYSKKVFLSLCVLPDYKEREYLDKINKFSKDDVCEDQCENITNNETVSYSILGEDYNWKDIKAGKEVFSLSTKGTKSTMLQLEEGISVIHVWLKVPAHYSLQILSQVEFLASTLEEIQEQLVDPSSSFVYYGEQMLNTFVALSKTNGETEDRLLALQEFKKTYLPPIYPESYVNKMDCIFEEAMLLTLKDRITENEQMYSIIIELQSLLCNALFGSNILQEIEEKIMKTTSAPMSAIPNEESSKLVKNNPNPKKSPKSATKKQSKKDKTVSNTNIQRSTINVFDIDCFIKILMHMLELDNENLMQYFPFSRDLEKRLVFSDYKGSQQTSPTQDWLPLLRFVVNFHVTEPVLCGFNFNASIINYTFRVIDNEEIPHGLMDIAPTHYSRNNQGYTLLGYGKVDGENQPEVAWKLRILAQKNEYLPHSCNDLDNLNCTILEPSKISVYELKGHYVPNRHKNICRCILKTDSLLSLTLRLGLSNSMVEFTLKIMRKSDNDVLMEYSGRGELIVPVIELPKDNENNSDEPIIFQIEAYVLKRDGWPLSSEEKLTVDKVKETISIATSKSCAEIIKPARLKSVKKISSSSVHNKPISLISGAPFWSLQLVTELDTSHYVFLDIDREQEEQIRQLKASWEENDPGRRERAMEIRNEYLREHPDCTKPIADQSSMDMRQNSLFTQYFDTALDLHNYKLLDDCLHQRENELQMEFDNFSSRNEDYISGRKRMLQDQLVRTESINLWKDMCRITSEEVMQRLYDARAECIQHESDILEQKKKEIDLQKKGQKKENKKDKTKKPSKGGKK